MFRLALDTHHLQTLEPAFLSLLSIRILLHTFSTALIQHHALWLSAIDGALSIYHRALCCRVHLSLLTTMICFSKMWWPSTAFMENCASHLWRNVLFAKLDARVMLISRHLHVTYRTTCQLLRMLLMSYHIVYFIYTVSCTSGRLRPIRGTYRSRKAPRTAPQETTLREELESMLSRCPCPCAATGR